MCGIAGLFHPLRPILPDHARLRRMNDALAHRGPDGSGEHFEPGLALGHRRLSIVDLAGGAQPMTTEDERVCIVFNGEIYNHAALRRELEAAGHRFRTRSDTEAILLAWREWGVDCLARLDGMFAFALWDRDRAELLLARDRLGEKPLDYAWLPDGSIAFASEPAALLTLPDLPRGLDPAAVDAYLALGYVPDPATIHAAIRRLPAAHFMLLRRGEAGGAPRRYWRLPTKAAAAPADAPAELAARLDAAVRARLMADVPLGAFLSGGVDSAGVAALAARAAAGPLATFTIGFEGANDERAQAAAVATLYQTEHHAEAGNANYVAAAREQGRLFGEPFGDHSSVPTLAVSQLARRHVTVALTGDGGDEVFAGYRRYRWHSMAEAVRRYIPTGARRHVIGALARAYPQMAQAPRWLRAKSTLTEISLDSALGYYRTVCKLHEERRRGLLSPRLRAALDGYDPSARIAALMAECDPDDGLLQAQYADLQTYLPGDILVKVDRMSMAASLEVRPPLLDPLLVAWGLALPAGLKLQAGRGKEVLRRALAPYLPNDLLFGPKRGFAADIAGQLRAQLPELRARLMGPAMLDSGLFDGAAVSRMVDEHGAGTADHAQALWQLLTFEAFLAAQGDTSAPPERMLAVPA
jgi:asparagine synthase (glutamine-hydrolysing)